MTGTVLLNTHFGYRHAKKVFNLHGLTDDEAIMVEPTACAIHGMDILRAQVGIEALVLGAGPTGLVLAQLLKLNGASRVTLAANKGIKTKIAGELGFADELIEFDRKDAAAQWDKLRSDNPYGFDVVIEATGSEIVANDAIHLVRRGGTLLVYGVYSDEAKIHWPPTKIFRDEITVSTTTQCKVAIAHYVAD
jgi:D-arabinitol dehydrogenase (NADP+)